ncbi:CopG family transcriptional regulator [Chloroflexota bacterium]
MKKREIKAVSLPSELYRQIEDKVKTSGFGSVDEYVIFVLKEVLREDEGEEALNQEYEEEVKKRLKRLGYMG